MTESHMQLKGRLGLTCRQEMQKHNKKPKKTETKSKIIENKTLHVLHEQRGELTHRIWYRFIITVA